MPRILSWTKLTVGLLLVSTACSPAAPPSPAATAAPAAPPPAATAKPAAPAAPAAPAPAAPAAPAAAAKAEASPAAKPAAADQSTPAAKPVASAEFQRILAAARQEAKQGNFNLWVSSPKLDQTHKEVMEAFQKRFALDGLQWDWLSLGSPAMTTRAVAEAQAGKITVDVLSGSPSSAVASLKGGYLEDIDWLGIFSSELPSIREPVERMVNPAYTNKLLLNWDSPLVMSYNKDRVKAEDVPDTIQGMADPKWSGTKFAIDSSGAGMDIMSLKLGVDRTLELERGLVANRPLIVTGAPAAGEAVGTGQVMFSPNGIVGSIDVMKAKAPVDWKALKDGIPLQELVVYPFKGGPHPNLARLFVAWFCTEAMPILDKNEGMARISDPTSELSKSFKAHGVSIDAVVRTKTLEEDQAVLNIREQLTKIVSTIN